MAFRITTWNVNGIRNPFGYQPWREQRTFQAMFDILEADIVVMQETKIQRKDLQDDMVLVPGWDVYFSLPQHKKGYSGVAIYTRSAKCAAIRAEEGLTGVLHQPKTSTPYRNLPSEQQIGGYPQPGQLSGIVDDLTLDSEGRCLILEFPAFVLFGVYSPANRDESRDDFRIAFLEALDSRIRNLVSEGKQVILVGDLNIVRSEIDCSNVAERLRKANVSIEEWLDMSSRRTFRQLIFPDVSDGHRGAEKEKDVDGKLPVLWDLCRYFHPHREGMNTCWDTKKNTRPSNNGSRIDYVLCSDGLRDWFVHANIQEGLMGSDHCPVYATISPSLVANTKFTSLAESLNPPGVFSGDNRLRGIVQKDMLPLSAKLIPEFDGRRNILDMFNKKGNMKRGQDQSQADANDDVVSNSKHSYSLNRPADHLGIGVRSTAFSRDGKVLDMPSDLHTESQLLGKQKRVMDTNVRSPKRSKTNQPGRTSNASNGAGQRTLQGFFKPINPTVPPNLDKKTSTEAIPNLREEIDNNVRGNHISKAESGANSHMPVSTRRDPQQDQGGQHLELACNDDKVFDPIEAKESWSKLLGKRVAPRCEHGEFCISLVTKKPGINCGRSFYICPRPLGPTGEKEKGTEWRCGTFIWSSDWNKSRS